MFNAGHERCAFFDPAVDTKPLQWPWITCGKGKDLFELPSGAYVQSSCPFATTTIKVQTLRRWTSRAVKHDWASKGKIDLLFHYCLFLIAIKYLICKADCTNIWNVTLAWLLDRILNLRLINHPISTQFSEHDIYS